MLKQQNRHVFLVGLNGQEKMPDWSFENAARYHGHLIIAGIDEAGRGPLAGPVVAAAVILERNMLSVALKKGLDDSKKVKPEVRADLCQELKRTARFGIGQASVVEIDVLNILQATLLAMSRAVASLGPPPPEYALVDGNQEPLLNCPVRCVIKGDSQSFSIAAASIIAKVTRDQIMQDLDSSYPGYGWDRNSGYGTQEHRNAISCLGITAEHRRSFAPVRKMLRPD